MTDNPPTDVPAWLRILAERRGLTRALVLLPALSRSALGQAAQPLPPVPTGTVTKPAGAFVPDAHRDAT